MAIKKIAYRAGHNPQAPGAVGILNEIVINREVLPHFGEYLKSLGYETLDVTPPHGMNRNEDLSYGVNKANAWGADLFISLHVNKAYDRYNGGIGSEVCAYSISNQYAINVANSLFNLGFTDDAGQQRRKSTNGLNVNPSLYELKRTKMPAMIVEMFFLEATKDVALYQKLGAKAVAKAIAEGIEGKKVQSSPQPTPAPSRFPLPLQMSEDAMVYAKEIRMFAKRDRLTADAENKYAYAIELEGERCWVLKDDVRLIKNLEYPYESRFYLECIEDNVRAWRYEVRSYNKNDYITVRDEISGYYFIDTGETGTGWIKKSSTKNR